jgi:hypothetical protein
MNAWRFQTTAGLSDGSSKMEFRAVAVVIASATELPGRDRTVFVPCVILLDGTKRGEFSVLAPVG